MQVFVQSSVKSGIKAKASWFCFAFQHAYMQIHNMVAEPKGKIEERACVLVIEAERDGASGRGSERGSLSVELPGEKTIIS